MKATKTQASANQVPAETYVPTPQEQAVARRWLDRQEDRPPTPGLKVKPGTDGVPRVGPDHPDVDIGRALIMEAIGTGEHSFYDGLISQLVNLSTSTRLPDERGLNFALAIVTGIEPRDQLEAMLAAQMAAVHNATMTFARRLAQVDNIPQQDSAERAFNKLARTFASQLEALKRYRSTGEQRMRIERVTVNEGGQAIVGHVSAGGRVGSEKRGTTP